MKLENPKTSKIRKTKPGVIIITIIIIVNLTFVYLFYALFLMEK